MPIIAKRPEHDDYEKTPAGNFAARCYQVVDLGICEKGGMYPGKAHMIRWAFEIDEKMSDGKPFSVSEKLTLSLSEKARLYQRLVSWRGRPFTKEEIDGFDVSKVAGVPCLINVVHSKVGDKVYANIASIAPLPRGMKAPEPFNPQLVWGWGDDESALPDWLRKMLGSDPRGPVYEDSMVPVEDDDDEIPF